MKTFILPNITDRKTRITSAIVTLVMHLIILVLMIIFISVKPEVAEIIELDWGSSSGAPNRTIEETDEVKKAQQEASAPQGATEESKVELPQMKSSSEEVIPAADKVVKKSIVGKKTQKKTVEDVPLTPKRIRAGGAGKTTGYSIEWTGVGSRRLLSGRIPTYPEGTDKEMPVVLQFMVLPDGSLSSIIPLKRSDELLEREALAALRTWRFDPLPPQFEQKAQTGKVTFIFKLE